MQFTYNPALKTVLICKVMKSVFQVINHSHLCVANILVRFRLKNYIMKCNKCDLASNKHLLHVREPYTH